MTLFGTIFPLALRPSAADAMTTPVVISEFLALNKATLADNTGAYEDWIELHNTTGSTVDLGSWTIADGSEAFTFPPGTSIIGGQYLVIWASGEVSRTTANQIHLPFKLSGTGEPLTLSDPVGTLSEPGWPAGFPTQLEDDSYGIASGGEIRYFTNPTPGSSNGGGVGGLVAPVSFSVDHGFYGATQNLVLDTATSGATIRYTTNGDLPTANTGTAITPGSSISVSETSTFRAVAYRDGWIPSPVETRSYLFTADIIDQGQPDGWPTGPIRGVAGDPQELDYGMDNNVVNGNEAAVQAALVGIPSLSIVSDLDNLLDPDIGIYVNADERGSDWERPASVELIDPTGAEPGFDIEAGIRIRGGFSRRHDNPKHALRLFFGDDYESELNYPLFGAEGDDRFEKVDLRTASNYAWSWRHSTNASFIEELWSRDTQGAMGQPYTRSRPYHVYLNGTYWGLYMTQERVSGEFGESYFGGDEDDYDIVKRGAPGFLTEATAGTDADWKSLYPLVRDLDVTPTEFAQIEAEVDLVNLADYYLLHFFSGDVDGSPTRFAPNPERWSQSNNWYALRDRTGAAGAAAKWQFFDHDSEHSLCLHSDSVDNTIDLWNLRGDLGDNTMAPAFLHAALVTDPTYRQIFTDRVQLHMLTPGGALTAASNEARLNARAAQVSPAIEAESARWGDGGGEPAFGRSQWTGAVEFLRNCLDDRHDIVEDQLRDDGLWPLSDAAVISPAPGAVPFGTTVSIDDLGQGGTTYYTVDGTDPRASDGSVSAAAQTYNGPLAITGDTVVTVRVLVGGQWTPLAAAAYTLSTPPGPVSVAVNEFNAVSSGNFLGGGTLGDTGNGSDATLGRLQGNGGDWFELVVIEDDVDVRGWTVEIWNEDNGVITLDTSLTLTNATVFDGLASGTLITISEDIDDDISYSPIHDDWHINLRSNNALAGGYITAGSQANFAINNSDTQIAIFDAAGTPVQLRTGEGTVPEVSVSSSEVFKLEGTPTTALTPDSALFNDGTTSTFGLPNSWSSGASTQDLGRIMFGDVNCDNRINITDALLIAQFSVFTRTDHGACPLADPTTQAPPTSATTAGSTCPTPSSWRNAPSSCQTTFAQLPRTTGRSLSDQKS